MKCSKCPKKIRQGKEKYIATEILCEKCFIRTKYKYEASSFWSKWIKEIPGKKN